MVADLVRKVYPSRDPGDLDMARAFAWWDQALPPRIAKNARPVRLWRGELLVHAVSAAWAQELHFAQEHLLASIRTRVTSVRALRVRVGPLPDAPSVRAALPPVFRAPLAALPEDLARELARVRSEPLRAAIEDAARVALGALQPVRGLKPRARE